MDFDPTTAVADDQSPTSTFDPTTARPALSFSDDAMRRALTRPSSTTVMMSPSQYLALSPAFTKDPKSDKKGADLQKSLNRGDEVDDVPGLEVVVGKDGIARVTDQDGRHRAQAAIDAGLTEIPVVIQKFGDKAPIKSLVGMREGAQPVPFQFKAVTAPPSTTEPAAKPTPAKKSFLERVRDAVYVPPERRDPTFSGALVEGLEGIPSEIGREISSASSQVASDLSGSRPLDIAKRVLLTVPGNPQLAADIASVPLSLLTGTATSAVGRPVEQQTGLNRNITGNVLAAMLAGPGGEAKAAKGAESAVEGVLAPEAALSRAAMDADHVARVGRLQAEGVQPTLGQARGGMARRFEEGHKSDPLVGEAIRASETHALQTYNRALYNRVLEPLGIKLQPNVPVGRNSVKVVGEMVSRAYDRLMPKMKLVPDDEAINGLADIRSRVGELPPAQQAQFEAILNNRVIHRLGKTGEMDGMTFKQVESELSTLSRGYKGDRDMAQRGLGEALEDVMGVLRDNLERSSSPEIRSDLQKANKSWALLTRLEDASARRAGSDGLVTPMDLLSAIRKADRTVRHRSFARGDTMLQKFGEDGHAVLGNKLPDSGTPERLALNHNGLLMYLAGRVTNPVTSLGMNLLRRSAARVPTPQNNLLHPQLLRRTPLFALGNIPNALNQAQGQ